MVNRIIPLANLHDKLDLFINLYGTNFSDLVN